MSIVTITIGGKEFKISCSNESKDKLIMLSEKLDSEIREMAAANQHSSLELLLVMKMLKSMDQRFSSGQASREEIAENINDSQKQLADIFLELKNMAKKVEEC